MTDFSKYLFHCSFLPTLMTDSRTKSELLSATAKTGLRELWIKEVFDREKYDTSKEMDKGILCEPDSMGLVHAVTNKAFFKNKKTLSNSFLTGTPDVIKKDFIMDIKTSWNIFTFSSVTEQSAKKTYYWQLLGYMELTKTKTAELFYCLVNTPEDIIQGELYRLGFRIPELATSETLTEKVRKNYIFDDIDPKLRLKHYTFEYSQDDIEKLRIRILEARIYLESLTL